MFFSKKINILPRWLIACLDSIILFISIFFAYFLATNFDWLQMANLQVFQGSMTFVFVGLLVMFLTKSYTGIVRHTGIMDGMLILRTVGFTVLVVGLLNFLLVFINGSGRVVPFAVLIIGGMLSLFFLITYRLLVKDFFRKNKLKGMDLPKKKILIYGAGEAGSITYRAVVKDSHYRYLVYGFLDDDPRKKGKYFEGLPVFGNVDELADLSAKYELEELIIAIIELTPKRRREIIDACIALDIHAMTIPPVNQWVGGNLSPGALRDVKIEDLLGRESICLKNKKVSGMISGKRVLVTGAAGSIGSELSRQIARCAPEMLILLDIAESPLHDQEVFIRNEFRDLPLHAVLEDVTNLEGVKRVFENFQPEYVFHAAALKHVPMMEKYPAKAVQCNLLGTKNVADCALAFGVKKMVMVSTDKAVNPTNVMGASKRLAEMYVQSLDKFQKEQHQESTGFITTRFGNVLGSNGSVIPLFKRQLKSGGPLTVTDPDVTRYFMTIPEACDLVLEAGVMGNGGEIYVFDMGEPIRIIDLARKMIYLSGKKPGKDIEIEITGLRPGEKLYEEVLDSGELSVETHHPKIKIALVRPGNYQEIKRKMLLFETLFDPEDEMQLVGHMKKMVPEYISKMSRFELLDGQKIEK
ncbi:NDP-sugar epimerase, includes UDP-GlcNAc-inverting 4,6-dehydratase FlaA1 and capsular polysaccharide biosynthesis protein EpsC [Cyclobacterium lianum]|uniref:NDP-sugar epimerase, includes UDP-GlcNAc-inverting 4,6-dehydratase FlaA1 and capsular polysaccharide biosynthesis protein EpsC n=1 Tax=Cyclobacterium lianum TaxID=388280 RepID=A0A1M7PE97_9BACT|nr:nucleoside-diphosphate sugar epimerase/dehydratase [Cyclobacterium lianum]SHN15238.1 NDP-sugar epimerase, includes UDP-GlcNAc-inverting 4,6-dehydratase FlaA1 and capsular polysaccharide biosynthesis protein EpsC [Cyclobacterium lianum]